MRILIAFLPGDSWNHSAGINGSLWQAPLPNLIPLEFQELPGFCQILAGNQWRTVKTSYGVGLVLMASRDL